MKYHQHPKNFEKERSGYDEIVNEKEFSEKVSLGEPDSSCTCQNTGCSCGNCSCNNCGG